MCPSLAKCVHCEFLDFDFDFPFLVLHVLLCESWSRGEVLEIKITKL